MWENRYPISAVQKKKFQEFSGTLSSLGAKADYLVSKKQLSKPPSGEFTMTEHLLCGKRIAFLATDGFEQVELTKRH